MAQELNHGFKKQILIIGTFHYHNPGSDVSKTLTFDVLNKQSQQDLKRITAAIKEFGPNKIFVEWPFDQQQELDSLYQAFEQRRFWDSELLTDFYKKNEIFQLGFRAAIASDLPGVIGIDYLETQFPFDSLMNIIHTNGQSRLKRDLEQIIASFTTEFNAKMQTGTSLLDLTYFLNTKTLRDKSNRLHAELPLLAGDIHNFVGPFLTAEWHRRNLYMWSLIQKQTQPSDRKVVVLLGASHIAMLKTYIDQNEAWEAVELIDLLK
ncbi:hypothetical protein Musp01_28750 [Muricauda sp. NBRC 101325]|nr:hypothetical protein Musp01_28750 [Muricauda sp. NBRC 101325]